MKKNCEFELKENQIVCKHCGLTLPTANTQVIAECKSDAERPERPRPPAKPCGGCGGTPRTQGEAPARTRPIPPKTLGFGFKPPREEPK